MHHFFTARHLASLAGICPGNNKTGGKPNPAIPDPATLVTAYHILSTNTPTTTSAATTSSTAPIPTTTVVAPSQPSNDSATTSLSTPYPPDTTAPRVSFKSIPELPP